MRKRAAKSLQYSCCGVKIIGSGGGEETLSKVTHYFVMLHCCDVAKFSHCPYDGVVASFEIDL